MFYHDVVMPPQPAISPQVQNMLDNNMNDDAVIQDHLDMAKVLQEQAQQNEQEVQENSKTPPTVVRKLSMVKRQKNVSF